ncbi:hypothetical protein GCM10007304_19440 [Rhodococcoides trifolii]|uniref:Cell division protein FtsL n=1 Tax=Rhodococcoides trifolii TaxID=908250 RepID=A0A917D0C0_9NOCA|nr:hypothetical protein [Rhodococcus trifolii]GGG05445.1 hypothetical protein GCM10007304_19440 [Rhodococcus trifolii]
MSVPVTSPRRDLEVSRPSTRTSRTGAAKRAYDKRQQRAQVHTKSGSDSPRAGGSIAARIPFVTLVIGLLSVGLALTLLLTTRSTEDSYALTAQRQQNQSLAEQAAGLERDVETANSAPELAKRAKELGMIPTKDVPRLVVAPDGSVQVIGKPAPAAGPPAPDFDAAAPTGPVVGSPNTAGATALSREALTPVGSGTSTTSASATPTPTASATPSASSAPTSAQAPAPAPSAPTTTPAPAAVAPAPAAPAPAAPAGEQQVPA